jgi:class 3 adenylate cyclase/thiamine kinase-like enzyme
VKALTGGYVARVLLIIPSRKEGKDAPQAVKIGKASKMRDEKKRFDEYVYRSLTVLAPSMIDYVEHKTLGAIAYPYLRDGVLGETLLLSEYYLRHPAAEILAVLDILLKKGLGEPFYQALRPANKPIFYQDYYSRHIVPDLEIVVDEVSTAALPAVDGVPRFAGNRLIPGLLNASPKQTIQLDQFLFEKQVKSDLILYHKTEPVRVQILSAANILNVDALNPGDPVWVHGYIHQNRHHILEKIVATIEANSRSNDIDINSELVTVDNTTYANPLTRYQNLLHQEMPDNLSVVHGDLHTFNVIVDSHHRPYLIDFGLVGVNHRLHDFIKLEVHLRHVILGQLNISAKAWLDFERRLLCAMRDNASEPPAHPDLEKAYLVIRRIHQIAQHYVPQYRPFTDEYLPALFLYSLATLKFHKSNGPVSAFHAFLTCTAIGTYLQDEMVCTPVLLPMAITDPTVEQYTYYLRRSAGDSPETVEMRHTQFLAILQQVANALRKWLDLPPIEVLWADKPLDPRKEFAQQYFGGPWQHPSGSFNVVLLAYQMNDSYVVRTAVFQIAADQPVYTLTDLQAQFPWQPDRDVPEYLGEQLFAICQSDAPPDKLAQRILNAPLLPHTQLTIGDLYAPLSLDNSYLLIYQNTEQEALAKKAFDGDLLELGWYVNKVLRQERIYEEYLYPAMGNMRKLLTTLHDRARGWLDADDAPETHMPQLPQLVREIDRTVFRYNDLVTTARNIQKTVETNIKNLNTIVESGIHLDSNPANDLFASKRRQLQRAPDQILVDVQRWEANLLPIQHLQEQLRAYLPRLPYPISVKPIHPANPYTADSYATEQIVTIMFDDIVDSTGYIQAHDDQQWQQLVQLHDRLLHPIVTHYEGRVVNQLGDGHLTIFSDATKAVLAALDIQRTLHGHNETAPAEWQLPVRIGLHTGKALVGTMVLGLAVNLAARVCETAVSGEVVISKATYEMSGTAVFVPLGENPLKGFDDPVDLYGKRP